MLEDKPAHNFVILSHVPRDCKCHIEIRFPVFEGEWLGRWYIEKPSGDFEIEQHLLDAAAGFPIENMNFFGGYGERQDCLSIKVMDIGKANR